MGIDTSPQMLDQARQRLPEVQFTLGDVAFLEFDQAPDLLFANAVLQFVPDHATVLPRLMAKLAPGGQLATQMPDNLDEPTHVAMRAVAGEARWKSRMTDALEGRATIEVPSRYYELLKPISARVDVWRTTYFHPLAGIGGVIEWFRGSALRPFLEPLDQTEQEHFIDQYRKRLGESFYPDADGIVLLPFPRLFIVASR